MTSRASRCRCGALVRRIRIAAFVLGRAQSRFVRVNALPVSAWDAEFHAKLSTKVFVRHRCENWHGSSGIDGKAAAGSRGETSRAAAPGPLPFRKGRAAGLLGAEKP